MKKMLLLCGVMLALTAIAAFATPGVKLAWTDCAGDGGVANKDFACASNSGSEALIFSWEPQVEVPVFNSCEAFVDIYFPAGGPPPAWWFGCAGKTPVSISITPPASLNTCQDIWAGAGLAALAAYNSPLFIQHGDITTPGPQNTVQIDAVGAIPAGSETDVLPATEYYCFSMLINRTKTTGTGACAGCNTPAIMNAQGVWITQPTGPLQEVYTQSDKVNATQANGTGVVDTHSKTWGALKAMYR